MPPTDPRTDQQLIAALNRGDQSAFTPLYHRHKDWVYAIACRFATDRDAALDVMQNTFSLFLARFPGFTLTAKLTTYLYPIIKNAALAARRRTRRLKFGETPEPPPAAPDIRLPDGDLGAALASLGEGQLEVVLMRIIDGMSVEETATALGLPEGTVKSRLHAALTRLRERLEHSQ